FKLFSGTTQLTGCKSMKNAEEAAGYVIEHLLALQAKGVDIYADEEDDSEATEKLPEPAVTNLDIKMQNYDFNLGFKVDRKALARLINGKNGFFSSYEPGVTN